GCPKTQSIQDAAAHAQGIPPLACAANEQVLAMRQYAAVAHRLRILRILQGPPGPYDRRRL
ncbi:MAG: LSU ribosomal protein L32p @ LSU ribosomal protein L32p, zinc-dependent, partial [uncultured Chthoniobacterales bacterium]